MNEAMYTPYDNLSDEEFLQLLDKSPQTPLLASAYKRLAAAAGALDELAELRPELEDARADLADLEGVREKLTRVYRLLEGLDS